jgi:hypothetical protein
MHNPTHFSIPETDPTPTESQTEILSTHIPVTQQPLDSGEESDSDAPAVIGLSVAYDTLEGCDILAAPAFPPSYLNSQFVLACSFVLPSAHLNSQFVLACSFLLPSAPNSPKIGPIKGNPTT